MKRILPLLLIVLFIGCDVSDSSINSLEEVNFKTLQDSYTLGSTITVTLKNNSEDTVGYNLCFSNLKQKQLGVWATIDSEASCTAQLVLLEPGKTAKYNINLAARYDLQETGTYRITTEVLLKGEEFKLATEPFKLSEGFRPL